MICANDSKIRNHTSLDHEHLYVNQKGPLCREFGLPRVTDAKNAFAPRESRDNERFRNPNTIIYVASMIILSLPIVILTIQA